MGWTLFQGGVTKLVTYLDETPLMGLWSRTAGSQLIDQLNM